MLAARQLLNLIEDMVHQLARSGDVAVPEILVQGQYIAIVCMLRSVGHVLDKTDCSTPLEHSFLREKWAIWKKASIFSSFIEPSRNALLKEFSNQLRLSGVVGDPDFHLSVSADPSSRTMATVSVNFNPENLTDIHGRKVLPLFRQAIAFWQGAYERSKTHGVAMQDKRRRAAS